RNQSHQYRINFTSSLIRSGFVSCRCNQKRILTKPSKTIRLRVRFSRRI
ncbi:hypothetical protein LINGRAHAP2_LOCUS24639, partial [Linum grandiflorum]